MTSPPLINLDARELPVSANLRGAIANDTPAVLVVVQGFLSTDAITAAQFTAKVNLADLDTDPNTIQKTWTTGAPIGTLLPSCTLTSPTSALLGFPLLAADTTKLLTQRFYSVNVSILRAGATITRTLQVGLISAAQGWTTLSTVAPETDAVALTMKQQLALTGQMKFATVAALAAAQQLVATGAQLFIAAPATTDPLSASAIGSMEFDDSTAAVIADVLAATSSQGFSGAVTTAAVQVLAASGLGVYWSYTPGDSLATWGTTFARTTARNYIDVNGVLQSAAINVVRDAHYPYLGSLRTALREASTKFVCLQTEDWSTTWTAIGSPTLSGGTDTGSGISLSTVGDASASVLQGYSQNIAYTGNVAKFVAIRVKAGGTSISSAVRLRDTTAGADRLLGVVTWSGAVPVVTMTTGTFLGSFTMFGGVYILCFRSTAVTAANTNSLQFYPATDASLSVGATGTIIWGGVQAQDDESGAVYLKVTTVAISAGSDQWYLPQPLPDLSPTPTLDCSLYCRGIEIGLFAATTSNDLIAMDSNGTSGASNPRVSVRSGGNGAMLASTTDSGAVTNSSGNIAVGVTYGDSYDILADWRKVDAGIRVSGRKNGGSVTVGAFSTAGGANPANYANGTKFLTVFESAYAAISKIIICVGTPRPTIAQLAAI